MFISPDEKVKEITSRYESAVRLPFAGSKHNGNTRKSMIHGSTFDRLKALEYVFASVIVMIAPRATIIVDRR